MSATMPLMHFSHAIRKGSAHYEKRLPVEVRFFHMVWIFLICSFVGLVGETIVSFALDGRLESRAGFVVGPLSPIYGTGAVLFTLFVNPLRGHSAATQFAAGAIIGGLFEYLAGWFFETRYGIVAWSYIDQPFNLHGHTCLGIALVWGAIGLAWVLWGLPRMVTMIERIPANVRTSLTWFVFALLVADAACTLLALDCWFLRSSGLEPSDPVQQFFATYFNDSFMSRRFETMSMWPVLASR